MLNFDPQFISKTLALLVLLLKYHNQNIQKLQVKTFYDMAKLSCYFYELIL
jgi:hypothetical protein